MKKIIFLLSAAAFAACSNTKNATGSSKPSTTEELNAANAAKQLMQAGNDFYANGNSPVNWSMQIDFENKVSFTSDDGLALSFPANILKQNYGMAKGSDGISRPANTEVIIYSGRISAGDISIAMEDGTCTVPTIRKVFQKSVTVTINQKVYSGCGSYLSDEKLEGKWNLEKIGTTPITAADYNRVPTFTFDLAKKRISGNDGCNSLGSSIDVQGSKIKFSGMLSTKMACLKGKNIESIINTSISNKVADYYFKEGRLYLYLIDDTLLVFTRG